MRNPMEVNPTLAKTFTTEDAEYAEDETSDTVFKPAELFVFNSAGS